MTVAKESTAHLGACGRIDVVVAVVVVVIVIVVVVVVIVVTFVGCGPL